MIRDITIGQYYPADSRIHKLDPRVKIVCTLLYLISLFTFKSILGYVLATVFLFGCIKLAKVPFKFIVRGLKPIIILLLITVCFNLFLTPVAEVTYMRDDYGTHARMTLMPPEAFSVQPYAFYQNLAGFNT